LYTISLIDISVQASVCAVLQAATILVAMASGKNISRLKFWRKSPIGDLQIKRETYLKKYQKNLINETSDNITCLCLFPSGRSESRMHKLKMWCSSKWQI